MHPTITALASTQGGAVTAAQLRAVYSESDCRRMLRHTELFRVWHGVYSLRPPELATRLAGLDLTTSAPIAVCLGTAAQLFGFDITGDKGLHVLDVATGNIHPRPGLVVHQRRGAPVECLGGRAITSPAWTAIEVARTMSRPRALATLDAALAVGRCTASDLLGATALQAGRGGIRMVRSIVSFADGGAQSPMESETRLVLHDGGLPAPTLQHRVPDRWGATRYYLDFAWPGAMLAGEYDGAEHHSGALAMRKDKARTAWLQEQGWLIVPITVDDVRRHPDRLVARIRLHLGHRTHRTQRPHHP